jgi:hypothetical protein
MIEQLTLAYIPRYLRVELEHPRQLVPCDPAAEVSPHIVDRQVRIG